MGCIAKHVPLEVAFYVRKCGICFNSMLVPAKNLNAMYHVAGLWVKRCNFLVTVHIFCLYNIFLLCEIRDLKEHLRRLQQQSDSRRRAAVMEMMRQRAAEVANSSG